MSCQSWSWGPLQLQDLSLDAPSIQPDPFIHFINNTFATRGSPVSSLSLPLSLAEQWAPGRNKKIDFLIVIALLALLQPEVFSSHLSFDWFWHQLSNISFFIAFTIERFLSLSHNQARTIWNNYRLTTPLYSIASWILCNKSNKNYIFEMISHLKYLVQFSWWWWCYCIISSVRTVTGGSEAPDYSPHTTFREQFVKVGSKDQSWLQ